MTAIGSGHYDLVVQRVSARSQGTLVIPWPDHDPPAVWVEKISRAATLKKGR